MQDNERLERGQKEEEYKRRYVRSSGGGAAEDEEDYEKGDASGGLDKRGREKEPYLQLVYCPC